MAIQLPNAGLGDGKTGDNEFVMWTKVKDNFSNSEHAASKLMGLNPERIALNKDLYEAMYSRRAVLIGGDASADDFEFGYHLAFQTVTETPVRGSYFNIHTIAGYGQSKHQIAMPHSVSQPNRLFLRGVNGTGDVVYTEWAEFYSNKNTTVDSNKNIKTSSPVVRVFADHLDKIHEANDLPIKYTRNGVGDYTIEGTTGLRENDWQIVIPKDDHDNQLVAFTLDDNDGTIRLKTYKRIFSMETFTFGPDLNSPIDIPEGRWVDLHFNDLPIENLDDVQTEV